MDRGARELQNNVLAKREKTGSFLGVKVGRRCGWLPPVIIEFLGP